MKNSFYRGLVGLAAFVLLALQPLAALAYVEGFYDPGEHLDIGHRLDVYSDVSLPTDVPRIEDYSSMEDYYQAMDEFDTNFGIYFMSYALLDGIRGEDPSTTGWTALEGYESTSTHREFRPQNNINRAELAKMLMWSLTLDYATKFDYPDPYFPDVGRSDWFREYFDTAHKNGIIDGTPGSDGVRYADPAGLVNWAQLLKMIVQAYELNTGGPIDEASASVWYEPYWVIAQDRGILPYDDIDPSATVTREEVLLLSFRAFIIQAVSYEYGMDVNYDNSLIPIVMEMTHDALVYAPYNDLHPENYPIDNSFYLYDLIRTDNNPVQLYTMFDYSLLLDSTPRPTEEGFTLKNTSTTETMDISGYSVSILSASNQNNFRGTDIRYFFPEGTILEPEETITLTGEDLLNAAPTSAYYLSTNYNEEEIFVAGWDRAIMVYDDAARLIDSTIATFDYDDN